MCAVNKVTVVEDSYAPKLAELGVLYMPASFVTYQMPHGLMQDCLRPWGRITILVSEVGCEPLVVGPSAETLDSVHWDVSNFPGLSGGGGTMDRKEDSSYMLVFLMSELGVQPSLGTSCWVAV